MGVDNSTWRSRIGCFKNVKKKWRRKDARDEKNNVRLHEFLLAIPRIYEVLNNLSQSPEVLLLFGIHDPSKVSYDEHRRKFTVDVPSHNRGVPVFGGKITMAPLPLAVIEILLVIGGIEVRCFT